MSVVIHSANGNVLYTVDINPSDLFSTMFTGGVAFGGGDPFGGGGTRTFTFNMGGPGATGFTFPF